MSLDKSTEEAEVLDATRKSLLRTVATFTQAPNEELYWEISNLLGEYQELYLHHHQIEYEEIPRDNCLDALSTTTGVGIELPPNVLPFRKNTTVKS